MPDGGVPTEEARWLVGVVMRLGFLLLFFFPLWGSVIGWAMGMKLGGGRLSDGVSTADDWEDRRHTASSAAIVGGIVGLVVGLLALHEVW